jgi:hypothetical protein
MERRGSSSAGYVVVLVGAVTFVVGSFLPYWGSTMGGAAGSLSFFRLVVLPPFQRADFDLVDLIANVGGFLYLFGGVATLAWIAIAGIRGSRWTRSALAAVTVAWSLTWIGSLFANTRLAPSRRAGWWVLLLGVVVVVVGAIVIWISDHRAEPLPVQHVEG